ncbi:hypothetical protein [Tsukamurella paurometabola]|uniref:Uncharacterized protein n=1 Tax=Tsukamurella paurometabola TaxID=2061 RepID=A0ABS5NEW6_TSUPA|nr:hypothetical protein [Tsukamurella paurometabola]MBS4102417.1 hypothetical protein [Tsukamurella paurometabola]
MTVSELIDRLQAYPPDMTVKVAKDVDRYGGDIDHYSPVLNAWHGFVEIREW